MKHEEDQPENSKNVNSATFKSFGVRPKDMISNKNIGAGDDPLDEGSNQGVGESKEASVTA